MITAQEARELTTAFNGNLDNKIEEFVNNECEEVNRYIKTSASNGRNTLSYYFLIERILPADIVIEEIKSRLEKSGFDVTRYPVPRSSTGGDISAKLDISWQ